MPKVKLTNKFTISCKCEDYKPKTDFFDIELSGFMLEARKSGVKCFYYRYTKDTKKRVSGTKTKLFLSFSKYINIGV